MIGRLLRLLVRLITFPYRLAHRKISVQLVYSHVLVVILTVVVIEAVTVAVLLGLFQWGAFDMNEPRYFLGTDAQVLAATLGGDETFQSPDPAFTAEDRQQIMTRLARVVGLPGTSESTNAAAPAMAIDIERALVTDAQGNVLASTDQEWISSGANVASSRDAIVARTTQRAIELRGNPSGHDNTWILDWDGRVTVAAHPIINDQGDFVGVVTLQSMSAEPLEAVFTRELIFGVVATNVVLLGMLTVPAFLVSIPVGIWRSRVFSKRLSGMMDVADAMAGGNLSARVEVTGHDEISRLGERFNEMSDRLADVDRSRRAFVSNISHELRTPIAIIQGHAETLMQCGEPDERSLAVIQQESNTLERLVNDLFTLARIEEAALPFDLQPVSVFGVAAEAVEGIKTVAWEQSKVTVQSLVSPGLPPVTADRTRLRQILSNLLYNALRHTAEGGLIIVDATRTANVVKITVTDTGTGMRESDLERVFDRFYQVERSGRDRDGSGLGLAIVKQLVEAQGGSIDVASVPGEGTTFWFTLSLAT